MARVGLEQDSVTNETGDGYENRHNCVGTAEGTDREFCGSKRLISDTCDSDLQQVINAWPTLPDTVRRDILAMLQTIEQTQALED
jgi:hypothetical protein